MPDTPHVDTTAWRLPKKGGQARSLEDAVPDEAYAKLGIPVSKPTTSNGLEDMEPGPPMKSVDTSSWRLPKPGQAPPPAAAQTQNLSEVGGIVTASDIIVADDGREFEVLGPMDDYDPAEIEAAQQEQRRPRRRRAMPQPPTQAPTPGDGRLPVRHNAPERPGLQRAHVEVPPPTQHRMERHEGGVLPPDLRSEMRRLAGIESEPHIPFATGTPYRKLPKGLNEARTMSRVEKVRYAKKHIRLTLQNTRQKMTKDEVIDDVARGSTSHPSSYGYRHGVDRDAAEEAMRDLIATNSVKVSGGKVSWNASKAKLSKVQQIIVNTLKKPNHAGGIDTTWMVNRGTDMWGYNKFDSAMSRLIRRGLVREEGGKYHLVQESPEHDRQIQLAGLTESSPLPHPVNDGGRLGPVRHSGILDPDQEDGEAFVDRVLAESRWFLKDFRDFSLGVVDAFGEAPGGRAEPWQGAKDEPAKTPIVRKGKSHGAVGDDHPPEAKGAVDVGRSEIDYDHDPDDDDEHEEPGGGPPPKRKPKPKDQEEAEETRAGMKARRTGSFLRKVGHAMSHGRPAKRAQAGMHQSLRKRVKRLVKKHGIDTKRFHGRRDDDE